MLSLTSKAHQDIELTVGGAFDSDRELEVLLRDEAATVVVESCVYLDREQVKQLHAHLGRLLYASESASETPAG